MDDLAHRTVAKIWGGQASGGPRYSDDALLSNYLQRKQTGQWADLYARHSLEEMGQYMDAMESLAQKIGGV